MSILSFILIISLCLLILLLYIPCSYSLSIHLGTPYSFTVNITWGISPLIYHRTLHYTMMYDNTKKDSSPPPSTATINEDTLADISISDTSQKATMPSSSDDYFLPIMIHLMNLDILDKCISYIFTLLYISRIRQCIITGIIGLGDPYKTGILAGIIYTYGEEHVKKLAFDFLSLCCDCTITAQGYIYPAHFIWHTSQLLLYTPIRKQLYKLIQNKKG